jgi:hypothetical protein
MGSWSVYCGISHIAITSGTPCVFLGLKKAKYSRINMPYEITTLPIFGKYDDYGGIEDIESDENTKLIEEHFDCTIDEFCYYFTRGCIRDDEKNFPIKLKEKEELKDWTFMFINREVYDFMSTYTPKGFGWAGHFQMGDEAILKLIGFTQIGDTDEWELQGKKFITDGWSLECNGKSIYTFNGSYDALSEHIEIPEDKKWMGDKAMWQLWEHFESNQKLRVLFMEMTGASVDRTGSLAEYFLESTNEKRIEKGEAPLTLEDTMPRETLRNMYSINIRKFGKLFCDLNTIRQNLYPMSGWFEPHQLHVTPQCGEHEHHQTLLEKFAEINKKVVDLYEDDEDDED